MRFVLTVALIGSCALPASSAEVTAVERRAMNEAFATIWPGGPEAVRETLTDQLALASEKVHSDVHKKQLEINAVRVAELLKQGLKNRRDGRPALSVTNLREVIQTIVLSYQLTAGCTFDEASQGAAAGAFTVSAGSSCVLLAGVVAAIATAPVALPLVALSSVAWGVSTTTGAVYAIVGNDADLGRILPVLPGSTRVARWLGLNDRLKFFWMRIALELRHEPEWRRLGIPPTAKPEKIFAKVLTLLNEMAPPFLMNNACVTLLEQTLPSSTRALPDTKTGT